MEAGLCLEVEFLPPKFATQSWEMDTSEKVTEFSDPEGTRDEISSTAIPANENPIPKAATPAPIQ